MYTRFVPRPRLLTLLLIGLLPIISPAADKPDKEKPAAFYETATAWFRLRLVPRTPDQIAGFYEGRGFSPEALNHLRSRCFVTALIRNTSKDVVWLELDNWQFKTAQGSVARVERSVWNEEWEQLQLLPAHRATFGWTLLPESRDLRPQEPVGGNITLPPVQGELTVSAVFKLGPDKKQGQAEVSISGDLCRR